MYLPGFPTPIPGGMGPDQEYAASNPPRNSMDAPSPQEMADNYSYLSNWGAAVARAELAPRQAAEVAQGGRPGNLQAFGDSANAALGMGPADLLQEIAAAPKIGHKDEYQTKACPQSDSNANVCPPVSSAPGWGNSGISFPGPKVCNPVLSWISSNPWLFVGLVVAGGIALDSLMSDGK